MTAQSQPALDTAQPITRRPRIALMGEFSAGKSTLANLLLGQEVSPVKVTATQLPPVWYSYGGAQVLRVEKTGAVAEIAAEALDTLSHHDTQAVRISLMSDVLEFCDIVDMPGISDPNLPAEIWETMLTRCDGVVWCTPASQAWRQSEAAVWETQPAMLHARSLLLVTRIDKMQSDGDRRRVVSRVRHETEGLFARVMPISLTDALAAGDNADALQASGAERFTEALIEMVENIGPLKPDGAESDWVTAAPAEEPAAPDPATSDAASPVAAIVPRRVVPKRKVRSALRA